MALRGLCQHGRSLHLVMEYCPRGTLDLMLHHTVPTRPPPEKLLALVRSIARGMLHLHTRRPPILHRDLKPANIFVGKPSLPVLRVHKGFGTLCWWLAVHPSLTLLKVHRSFDTL